MFIDAKSATWNMDPELLREELQACRRRGKLPRAVIVGWLTGITIEPRAFGASREDVRSALEANASEARPTWKPLHMQPIFQGFRSRGGEVAREIFEKGLCLPSGSALSDDERERVARIIRRCYTKA